MQINSMNQVWSCDHESSAHLVSKYDLICQLAIALLLDGKVLIEFSPSVKRCISTRSENYNFGSCFFSGQCSFFLYSFSENEFRCCGFVVCLFLKIVSSCDLLYTVLRPITMTLRTKIVKKQETHENRLLPIRLFSLWKESKSFLS